MTDRTLIEVFSHLFTDLLWLEMDRLYLLPAVTTKKSDITTFGIEGIFSFFSERRDIYEICVGGGHAF
jgi:hypothetical protein